MPLPADDLTLAMYLQALVDKSNTFSKLKSASASIAFVRKIKLFNNQPTNAPEVCMGRIAAARTSGLTALRVKRPFAWSQSVDFALL